MRSLVRLLLDWLRLVRSARARPYLLITLFVDGAFAFVFLVVLQSYLPEQHGGGAALPGYCLAAYGAAKLATQLIGGRVIDRIGARRGLYAGLGLVLLGQGALLLAALKPEAALPAAAVYGLGGSLVWPAIYALASDEFAPDERARLTSGLTLTTGLALGMGLGLGMALPSDFPYVAATIIAFVGAIVAAAAATSLRPSESEQQRLSRGAKAGSSLGEAARSVLQPQRIGFTAVILLQGAAVGALLAVFRSYGRDVVGVSFREEVLFLAPGAALGAAAVVVGGALSDRLGRIPLLGTGFLIATVAVWGLSVSSHPASVISLAAAGGLGLGLAFPSVGAMSMDLSRGAARGTILSWFMMAEGIGHAAGPAIGGRLSASAGTAPVLWLVGGLFAALALVAFVPPIWGSLSAGRAAPVRRANPFLAGLAKGGLVLALGLPVLSVYFASEASSQVYGHITTHGPRDRMMVALTFDDGPNDPWTQRIADVLNRYDVKATFFVVGKNADRHPELVRQLVGDGHLIGNHSYRHHKQDAVVDFAYGELNKAERSIAGAAGVCPAFFRPPNGFHTPWQLHAVAGHHMRTVTWDVIPHDWKRPHTETIVQRVLDSVRPGSIVLLHDGDDTNDGTDRGPTLAALPSIIEGLRAKGYRLVRLDELLSAPPYLPTCDGLQQGSQ